MENKYTFLASNTAIWIYYAVSLVATFISYNSLLGTLAFVALIMSYFTKGAASREGNELAYTHARWFIRTFWYAIGLLILSLVVTVGLTYMNAMTLEHVSGYIDQDIILNFDSFKETPLFWPLILGFGILVSSGLLYVLRIVFGMFRLALNKPFFYRTKMIYNSIQR